MLRVIVIIGLPYIAGMLSFALLLLLRPAMARRVPGHTPAPESAPQPAERVVRRQALPLRTWITYADRVRSDRDMVDDHEPAVRDSPRRGSYIPSTWTTHSTPALGQVARSIRQS